MNPEQQKHWTLASHSFLSVGVLMGIPTLLILIMIPFAVGRNVTIFHILYPYLVQSVIPSLALVSIAFLLKKKSNLAVVASYLFVLVWVGLNVARGPFEYDSMIVPPIFVYLIATFLFWVSFRAQIATRQGL